MTLEQLTCELRRYHLRLGDAYLPVLLRFFSYVSVDEATGCWTWQGAHSRGAGNKHWYGTFCASGKSVRAHRFASDILGGAICPAGHHRDHICRNSLCVNPDHIVIVPASVNLARRWDNTSQQETWSCHES